MVPKEIFFAGAVKASCGFAIVLVLAAAVPAFGQASASRPAAGVCVASFYVEGQASAESMWSVADPTSSVTVSARNPLSIDLRTCPGIKVLGVVLETCEPKVLHLSADSDGDSGGPKGARSEIRGVRAPATRFELRFDAPTDGQIRVRSQPCLPQAAPICLRKVLLIDVKGQIAGAIRPVHVAARVTASSALQPVNNYAPERLFDGTPFMAWAAHWVPEQGAFVEIAFDRPQRISTIRLSNGYHRSPEHLEANAAIRRYQVLLDGSKAAEGEIARPAYGQIDAIAVREPRPAKTLRVGIQSVYPGSKYQDIVVSELFLYDDATWVRVDVQAFMDEVAAGLRAQLDQVGLGTLVPTQMVERGSRATAEYSRCHDELKIEVTGRATASASSEGLDDGSSRTESGWSINGGFEILETKGRCATIAISGLLEQSMYVRQDNGVSEPERTSSPGTLKLRACKSKAGVLLTSLSPKLSFLSYEKPFGCAEVDKLEFVLDR